MCFAEVRGQSKRCSPRLVNPLLARAETREKARRAREMRVPSAWVGNERLTTMGEVKGASNKGKTFQATKQEEKGENFFFFWQSRNRNASPSWREKGRAEQLDSIPLVDCRPSSVEGSGDVKFACVSRSRLAGAENRIGQAGSQNRAKQADGDGQARKASKQALAA